MAITVVIINHMRYCYGMEPQQQPQTPDQPYPPIVPQGFAMEKDAPKKIVIVEDNQALADIYKTRLELLGYTVFIGYNGITGLYFIQQEHPDLVLLDLMVPDVAGDQILQKMRASTWGKDIPVFIISNLNEADAPPGLRELGIAGYAVKANLQDDQIDQIVNGLLRPQTHLEEGHLEEAEVAEQVSEQLMPVEQPPQQSEQPGPDNPAFTSQPPQY